MSDFRLRPSIWIVPLAIAGLVAALGWWGDQRLRETVDDELRSGLASTLDANVTALEIWAKDQARLVTSLAEDPTFRTLALPVLERRNHGDESKDLTAYLRARLEGLGYEIAHVVDTNFVVVANSRRERTHAEDIISDSHLAKFYQVFVSGQPVIITPFRPRHRTLRIPAWPPAGGAGADATNEAGRGPGGVRSDAGTNREDLTLMQVAAPVRDDAGVICGALALVINPEQEFTRILSVARAGKSGETYVFDQNGLMLSRSRFDDQLRKLGLIENRPGVSSAASLRLSVPPKPKGNPPSRSGRGDRVSPLIRLVANGVTGGSGVDVDPSQDYRGVPVIGAWRWLPRHGFGVVTQLDADEAFRPLRVLDLLFVMLFLLLMLCATGMFLFSFVGVVLKRRLTEAELKIKQLGQYALQQKIGEGAMGVVYRAQHALMRRDTAVKLLLPERADPGAIQRFEREVRLTCQLTHPNTIQVYDYGHTPEGVFYYAMELLEGLNLHQLITRFGAQPEGRVIYILSQVCDALEEAHALGLVHRDIKPANIFLCNRAGVPDWVKVLDFGLVRPFREGKHERTRAAVESRAEGTPMFMPPEAFRNSGSSDPRSDIYSLGAVGYFLLTAQYLFAGGTDLEIYEQHLRKAPTPPSQRTRNPISAELEETLLRCLEKEPNLRAQSVREFRELLLTSPRASDWGIKERQSWWARYYAGSGRVGESDQARGVDGNRTVKINLQGSVKASRHD